MGLSDTRIQSLKAKDKKYKERDEKGLYLLVLPSGGKYWKMAYRFDGKQRELSLEVYPEVTYNLNLNISQESHTVYSKSCRLA